MHGVTKLVQLFDPAHPYRLENGAMLKQVTVAYETHGELDRDGSNVILICHALTGDAHVAGAGIYKKDLLRQVPHLRAMKPGQPGWWDGMIGPGKPFDTNRFFIICSNILGSCYGTAGPASVDPETGNLYKIKFPATSVRDMVHLQYELIRYLGVKKLRTVTGGSLGGMQVLEWAVMYPEMVHSIIPIATSVQHSAWCIGINHLSRKAILDDPDWQGGNYTEQPVNGLGLARQIGMVSYRADLIFNSRFARNRVKSAQPPSGTEEVFQVESYLDYQGEKLVKRFDANCYLYLSWAMDQHDVARGRGKLNEVMGTIKAKTLCIGIDSDILYPAHEQQTIAGMISGAQYAEIKSDYGHDAFLIEFDQLSGIITPFLEREK